MNKINPGSPIKRINTKGGNFALMENHAAIQKSMKKYGVPEEEVFQTVDLFEARNIKGVVKSLLALGRTVRQIVINVKIIQNSYFIRNVRGTKECVLVIYIFSKVMRNPFCFVIDVHIFFQLGFY